MGEEAAQPQFPEEFVKYAKEKLAEKKEYVRHTAQFGSPFLKETAKMILTAAGEGDEIGK